MAFLEKKCYNFCERGCCERGIPVFGKYLLHLFKKHSLTYAIIAVCEVIMVVIALFSLCVILDFSSNNDQNIAQYYASRYKYTFNPRTNLKSDDPSLTEEQKAEVKEAIAALPTAEVMRDRIYEFCEKSPIKIKIVEVSLNYMKYNYFNTVMYFSTYEDMVNYCTKHEVPLEKAALPTEEQFLNREKLVLLSTGGGSDSGKYVFSDEQHLLFGNDGDEYLIRSRIPWNAVILFLGSEPDDAKVSSIHFKLDIIPTQRQADEIDKLFREIVVGEYNTVCTSYTPEIKNLLDIRKETATIIVTALLMFIMSFNFMTIIKFIIEKRKNDYAIFRLCGFSKWKALSFPMLETIGISAVCVVVSCALFELLKPVIALYSPVVYSMFDFGYYVCFVMGFAMVTAVLFLIYVLPTLNKSVSDELRGI